VTPRAPLRLFEIANYAAAGALCADAGDAAGAARFEVHSRDGDDDVSVAEGSHLATAPLLE